MRVSIPSDIAIQVFKYALEIYDLRITVDRLFLGLHGLKCFLESLVVRPMADTFLLLFYVRHDIYSTYASNSAELKLPRVVRLSMFSSNLSESRSINFKSIRNLVAFRSACDSASFVISTILNIDIGLKLHK